MLITCLGFALLMWFPGALNAPSNAQSCSPPTLNNGFFVPKKKMYPNGSQLTYACHEGRKPAVKGWWEQITCQDGKWSHEPQCIHASACLPLHIPNGQYSENSQGWYNEGDTISVTCNEGYEPKDLITSTLCSEGKWTDVPVCQEPVLKCTEPPKIPHAVIIDRGYQDEFPPNATVDYECEHGYRLEGGEAIKTAKCSYGTWSDTPNCTDHCGTPPRVVDGDIVEETQKYLKYQCSSFYTLDGSDTVVCQSDGTWSPAPTCLANFCTVDTATYGHLKNVGNQLVKSGDQQEFQCPGSYEISYGYCDDGQITFSRCCGYYERQWGRCP